MNEPVLTLNDGVIEVNSRFPQDPVPNTRRSQGVPATGRLFVCVGHIVNKINKNAED